MQNGTQTDRKRIWLGEVEDLEFIEQNDLQAMVRDHSAELVSDSRMSLGKFLVEEWTGKPLQHAVWVKTYVIYLKGGLKWRVPQVLIRLVYDTREKCACKIDMSQAHFQDLYACYFPGPNHDVRVVEGLEAQLHRIPIGDKI